jgi:hypothetical protein
MVLAAGSSEFLQYGANLYNRGHQDTSKYTSTRDEMIVAEIIKHGFLHFIPCR